MVHFLTFKNMKKVLITGGAGLVGRAVTDFLQDMGHEVRWTSRSPKKVEGVEVFKWDLARGVLEEGALSGVDVILHLAGAGIVDKRWTTAFKQELIDSRVLGMDLIFKHLQQGDHRVKQVISAGGHAIYKAGTGTEIDEKGVLADGFVGELGTQWETSVQQFEKLGIKATIMRMGLVVQKDEGVVKELLKTGWMRIAPALGGGNQVYAWIGIQDLCSVIAFLMNSEANGIYNVSNGHNISQKHFALTLMRAKYGSGLALPIPKLFLKLMLGQAAQMVLDSINMQPKRLLEEGFVFYQVPLERVAEEMYV